MPRGRDDERRATEGGRGGRETEQRGQKQRATWWYQSANKYRDVMRKVKWAEGKAPRGRMTRRKGAETPLICREERVSCPCLPIRVIHLNASPGRHTAVIITFTVFSACVFTWAWIIINSRGRIKYVCQVKNIMDFASRPHETTAWIMTGNNLHSTLSSVVVRGRNLSVRTNWKLFPSF